jgi:ACS family hexuronate transporter-like MFS transporter
MFPKVAVGSVIGIGGMSGAIGGALFQLATGYIVKFTNSYVPLFIVACSAYLLALVIIHLITPRLTPARID